MKNLQKIYKIILLTLAVVILVFTYNNGFLYKETVIKVDSCQVISKTYVLGENGEKEYYYVQEINGQVLNGKYKGEKIYLRNEYTSSGVRDEKYAKGDRLIVSIKESKDGLTGNIKYLKTDFYVVLLITALVLVLIFTAKKEGVISIITLIINIALFYIALNLYYRGYNIFGLTIVLIVLFSVITMLFINGFNKGALATILSVLSTMVVLYFIYKISITIGKEPEYIMMEYIVSSSDLEYLFLFQVLMGGLGAVMDVAVSICAAVKELCGNDSNISNSSLKKSVKEIGNDIMGTMINVLFFTFLSGSIPMIVLELKNSYKVLSIIKIYLQFEITCFLTGAIAVVLAIPISGFICIRFFGKKSRME